METTATDRDRSGNGDYRKPVSEAADAARDFTRTLKSSGKREINSFLADVEELISHFANTNDPEVTRVRAKVQSGLINTRKSISNGADQVQRQARDALDAGGRYVSENPWTASGIAALAGLTVGFLIARR